MKDEFVANVTHELRTPLTNLKLRHFLLRRQPERMELHLDVLERETARLTATIDDLLRLSRLDQGRMTLEHRPIDLCALVAQHVLDRSMLAEMEAISLSTLFDPANPPPLPAILGDEGLLGQALSILL
ncbi:HAMP domain-containing sensor histidine kinase, partial [Arthrospira platensis SPKY2]